MYMYIYIYICIYIYIYIYYNISDLQPGRDAIQTLEAFISFRGNGMRGRDEPWF